MLDVIVFTGLHFISLPDDLNICSDTEVLASSADDFRVTSRRVSRKMWWQNMKFNIIIGVVVVSIIVIIVVSVTSSK